MDSYWVEGGGDSSILLGHPFVFPFGSSEVGGGQILPLGACGFRVLGVEHWWSLVLGCRDFCFYWLVVELWQKKSMICTHIILNVHLNSSKFIKYLYVQVQICALFTLERGFFSTVLNYIRGEISFQVGSS